MTAAAAPSEETGLRYEVRELERENAQLERSLENARFELDLMTAERDSLEREQQDLLNPKPFRPDAKRVDGGDWTRASGLCVCDVCGFQYWEHAPVQGFQWVHRLCDGRLVKL